ncbi:hypothetical protein NHF46_24375 [Arthrobacter alpinus]|nr:hypothetical protein [Arthrobacter alpinus]
MSAGTLGIKGFAQESAVHSRPRMRAGYTSISAGTMDKLVAAIAADAFNVPLKDVRAGVHDQSGQVSVSLAVPLVLRLAAELNGRSETNGGTVFERAASGRQRVTQGIEVLAGSTVGRVDIRFTGIHEPDPRNAGRVQ